MKIERISKTQVKFLITAQDLQEKDVTLSEILTQSTTPAREFFREIMNQAISGFDIDIDIETCSIIMEAMPLSEDSIMIIVSKAKNNHDFNETASLIPESLTIRKFKQDDDIKIISKPQEDNENTFFVYAFESLDKVSEVAHRINDFKGDSILYKMGNKYYLVLENLGLVNDDLEVVLSEYGEKYTSSMISKYFLEEHGEVIIKRLALVILTSI